MGELGIELYDRTAEEVIGERDVSRELEVVDRAAMDSRGWGKSDQVRAHDVCHYLLVEQERSDGRAAWFLTKDRTLVKAAHDLGGGGLLFCFPLAGFLQSVSPFLEAPQDRRSLVDLFSAVLQGEIGDLSGTVPFELSELRIISEFHADVLATPIEELMPAFDYVKSAILRGKVYQRNDHPTVALELRKFLTSSAEEKQRVLEAEAARQSKVAAAERAKREQAEEDARDWKARASRLEAEVAEAEQEKGAYAEERLRRERAEQDAVGREARMSELEAEVQEGRRRRVEDARRERRLLAGLAVLGALVAAGVWRFDSEIVSSIVQAFGHGSGSEVSWRWGVRVLGATVLIGSFLPAIRLTRRSYRVGSLSVVAAVAVGGLDLMGPEVVASWSGYLAIGAAVATAIVVVQDWSSADRRDGS